MAVSGTGAFLGSLSPPSSTYSNGSPEVGL